MFTVTDKNHLVKLKELYMCFSGDNNIKNNYIIITLLMDVLDLPEINNEE